MSILTDAVTTLQTALRTVTGLRVYADPGVTIDPPGALVGPPALTWEGMCAEPTSATFLVYVIERADDRALQRLWELTLAASAAIDATPDGAVVRADPGVYNSGGTDLPCYELTIEVSL